MVIQSTPGYFVPPSTALRQDWTAASSTNHFEAGYSKNNGKATLSKRNKLKEKLSTSSKRNSGESYTSSLVQDREGHLHDPECMSAPITLLGYVNELS